MIPGTRPALDGLIGAFAVPVVEPLRVAKDGAIEPAHQHLVGVGIDANLARLIVADHDEPERHIAFIDEAVAGALAGGKSDIVAGLDAIALLAEAQRRLAFERNPAWRCARSINFTRVTASSTRPPSK